MRFVEKYSPLLSPDILKAVADEEAHLVSVQAAVTSLLAVFNEGASPSFMDVLKVVASTRLFAIPDVFQSALAVAGILEVLGEIEGFDDVDEEIGANLGDDQNAAISKFLSAPFNQIWPYMQYAAGRAQFDTHQGVKGLEFPRVMVIMDDSEAGGFTFKYDKLFGNGPEDATMANTRRLFYVTCSRAEESLCLIAYTASPDAVRQQVIEKSWFKGEEVITIENP